MRLLSSDMPRAAQRLAENELNLAYYSLREAGRELSVLTQLKNISALVNEERRLHRAESLIASQKTAMRDLMKIHAEAIDKGLPKVQDPEVRKLLVRSRDVLQATASFVDGVPPLSAGS